MKVVETPEELETFIDLLQEGYTAICKHKIPDTYEIFMQKILKCVYAWKKSTGGLAIMCSKNGKPLGFGACMGYNGGQPHKVMLIYAVYSNKKDLSAAKELMDFCEMRAKNFGCQELMAHTGRFSGAVFYWFENTMGFVRHCTTFKKAI